MDAEARLEAQAEEIDRLEARVDQLEILMGMRGVLTPIEWRLTGSESRVFGVLLARELASKDAVMAALYRDTGKDEADIKIVDVLVCKIRKKVTPFGIQIATRWGEGYYLTPAAKALARQAMTESIAA